MGSISEYLYREVWWEVGFVGLVFMRRVRINIMG